MNAGAAAPVALVTADMQPERLLRVRDCLGEATDPARGGWTYLGSHRVGARTRVVASDGTVTSGTYPETGHLNGGFTVVEVPSREGALASAAKLAGACRCAQEVPAFGFDPNA